MLFLEPLSRLAFFAASSDLHSHIVLVPFIAGYVLYIQRDTLPSAVRPSAVGALLTGGIGLLALGAQFAWRDALSTNDGLALSALAFVALLAAGGFLLRGSAWMSAAAFPVAFLLFMVPLPDVAVRLLESASVRASAEVAALFFTLAGTPLVRQDLVFELPGIVLQVARECSGIRSSWVLLITSVLAAYLFLNSPWRRLALVAVVIPLGILRNGFRVFVIGVLCVAVGPHMIDSPIHHRGGPIFFALSLVPLLAALWWLRRRERAKNNAGVAR